MKRHASLQLNSRYVMRFLHLWIIFLKINIDLKKNTNWKLISFLCAFKTWKSMMGTIECNDSMFILKIPLTCFSEMGQFSIGFSIFLWTSFDLSGNLRTKSTTCGKFCINNLVLSYTTCYAWFCWRCIRDSLYRARHASLQLNSRYVMRFLHLWTIFLRINIDFYYC